MAASCDVETSLGVFQVPPTTRPRVEKRSAGNGEQPARTWEAFCVILMHQSAILKPPARLAARIGGACLKRESLTR
jgi:hypothetical protein